MQVSLQPERVVSSTAPERAQIQDLVNGIVDVDMP
jgi:hypothetical protein